MKFDVAGALDIPNLPAHLDQVQSALERVTKTENPFIQQPVSRIVKASSKRLRSALVIAGAGGNITENVIAACTAIELVHLGSLVHDDIMDNAATRWGIQTVHKKEGVNQAILVGDYLFAKANQVAATVNPALAELIAAAIINLCEGQARELAAQYDANRTLDSYLTAIKGKTASLFSAACRAGASASEVRVARIEALGEFGEAFGLSFQLLDDVLDLISTPHLMSKPTASDIKEGVYTMPIILALEGGERDELIAYLQAAKTGPIKDEIYSYLEKPLQETLLAVRKYNQKATEALSEDSAKLAMLPEAYTNWALTTLVSAEHKDLIATL